MKKLITAALLFASLGIASAVTTSTPDGCMPGNGGMHPICNPDPGSGGGSK